MSETLKRVQELTATGEARISSHSYDELAADDLQARDIVAGVLHAVLVEDYPEYPKGPRVLVLQLVQGKQPIHVVWGIPKGANGPAVLITAYRPDPQRWTGDFLRRI